MPAKVKTATNTKLRATKKAQWLNTLIPKADDLSAIPGTHMAGQNLLQQVVL